MNGYDKMTAELPVINLKIKEILLLAGVNMQKVRIEGRVSAYFEKRPDGKEYYFNFLVVFKTDLIPTDAHFNLVNYFMSGCGKITVEFDFTTI